MTVPLARLEQIVATSGVGDLLAGALPPAVRHRQLRPGVLLIGMMAALDDGRPAHLTRVLAALRALPEADQRRLGVLEDWKNGPHLLTYRQVEHTLAVLRPALTRTDPDGTAPPLLQQVADLLLEASLPGWVTAASHALAVDWTDAEAWSHAVASGSVNPAEPEARWGHRNANQHPQKGDMFWGYYLASATAVHDEHGEKVPELARRMTVTSPARDPVPVLADVLTAMPTDGIPLGDVLADSGFSHRVASSWANPLRAAGAQLVEDLHPSDRGTQGTCQGAVICDGNLYCPATPTALLTITPLARAASHDQISAHDQRTRERARYKLGLHTAEDADGYRRLACPATAGKIRCPLRPGSMRLTRDRPEILTPPNQPPTCCTQQTITVGPDVAAKTRQKHDYGTRAWRRSYARRTAAERTYATIKDPASTTIARGWIRLFGLTPMMLYATCLLVVRNQRILTTYQTRADDEAHRAAAGQPPRARRRRRALRATPPAPL